MYPKPAASIRFAIRNCLARCRMTDAQLTCLSDFTQELWQAGWDGESIRAVQRGVLSRLYGEEAVIQVDRGPLNSESG